MACARCVSSARCAEERTRVRCWFGQDGVYHHDMSLQLEEDAWVFGLEDQFFPLPPLAEESEPAEDAEVSSAVDGLSEDFLQFLEKRMQEVMRGDLDRDPTRPAEGTAASVASPQKPIQVSVQEDTDFRPIPPVRRRRLQRSCSMVTIKTPPLPSSPCPSLPSTRSFESFLPHRKIDRPLRRSRSVAGDLFLRVKRWATMTASIRRAFCNRVTVEPRPSHSLPRFSATHSSPRLNLMSRFQREGCQKCHDCTYNESFDLFILLSGTMERMVSSSTRTRTTSLTCGGRRC